MPRSHFLPSQVIRCVCRFQFSKRILFGRVDVINADRSNEIVNGYLILPTPLHNILHREDRWLSPSRFESIDGLQENNAINGQRYLVELSGAPDRDKVIIDFGVRLQDALIFLNTMAGL